MGYEATRLVVERIEQGGQLPVRHIVLPAPDQGGRPPRAWGSYCRGWCGVSAQHPAPPAQAVRRVRVVFKTHLDLGYTALASQVKARYFEQYIPGAMALAETLRAAGGPEQLSGPPAPG